MAHLVEQWLENTPKPNRPHNVRTCRTVPTSWIQRIKENQGGEKVYQEPKLFMWTIIHAMHINEQRQQEQQEQRQQQQKQLVYCMCCKLQQSHVDFIVRVWHLTLYLCGKVARHSVPAPGDFLHEEDSCGLRNSTTLEASEIAWQTNDLFGWNGCMIHFSETNWIGLGGLDRCFWKAPNLSKPLKCIAFSNLHSVKCTKSQLPMMRIRDESAACNIQPADVQQKCYLQLQFSYQLLVLWTISKTWTISKNTCSWLFTSTVFSLKKHEFPSDNSNCYNDSKIW